MGERTVISYPDWVVFGSIALVCVPIGVARLSWGSQAEPGLLLDTLPWVALTAWLWLTYQVLLVEVSYDERGVSQVSPLTGHMRLAWSEIRRLHFFPAFDGFRLEASDGRHFTFNLWRVGADRLVDIALAKLGGNDTSGGTPS
jgi:hypothetical protein